MAVFRIRYEKRGSHYHCRVFSARNPNYTYAKNGDLCFSEDEWDDFKRCSPGVEFRAGDDRCTDL
jgi:hypothetical protein